MKIAIDTQVLIWFFKSPSTYTRTILNNLKLAGHELFIFEKTFQEFCDVLFEIKTFCKTKNDWKENKEYIEYLLVTNNIFSWIGNKTLIKNEIKTRDHKNDYLINLAHYHNMDLIVSNDKDLLIESKQNLPIKSIQETYKKLIINNYN